MELESKCQDSAVNYTASFCMHVEKQRGSQAGDHVNFTISKSVEGYASHEVLNIQLHT